MTVYEKGLFTILAVDALCAILALPLAFRKVRPNPVYGYRTPAVLRDEDLWYEANAFFGRRFLVWSLVSAGAAWFLADPGLFSPQTFVPVSVVLMAAPVALAGIATTGFVKGYTTA